MYLELFIDPQDFDRDEFPNAVEFLGRREVASGIEVEVVRERIAAVYHADGSTVVTLDDGSSLDLIDFQEWAIIQ